MSDELSVFHFEEGRQSFEDLGKPNGATKWSASDLAKCLGYAEAKSLDKAILKAKMTCLTIDIHPEDHFISVDGEWHMTRLGCYLVAMNGDTRKPNVAKAQIYFAALAETFQSHIEHADGVDRSLVRSEVTDGQKSLASTAKRHGVEYYAFFQDKGYRGMYNMSLQQLETFKGVPKGEILIDCMGREELAAHLFRITQTESVIKNRNIKGQSALEGVAHEVGRTVRQAIMTNTGSAPEMLPISENIKDVQKKLKQTTKALGDGKKKAVKKIPPKQ